jgi:CheY-like chemotaxis protein
MFFKPHPKHGKPLVLHVDDELLNREVLHDLLIDFGVEAISAAGGADGIAMAVKYLPQLVLMDVSMPGVNGFDACRAVKDNPATKDIPVIMLTGMEQMKDVEKAFSFAGASDYLTKPVVIDHLHAVLHKWLPKHPPAP